MKIEENTLLNTNQLYPCPQTNQDNFEHWIDTPTHQYSGDEYYWQHQEQLQHCCITFTTQTSSLHQKEAEEIIELQPNVSHCFTLQASNKLQSQCLYYSPTIEIQNTLFNAKDLKPDTNNSGTELVQVTGSNPVKNRMSQQTRSKNSIAINSEHDELPNTRSLKNHHLFIEDAYAELAINTLDLKQKEQQELMRSLKYFIKQHGLYLKKLIINGVTNE